MVGNIITAWRTPCNETNSKIFTGKSNNYSIDPQSGIVAEGIKSRNSHLGFCSATKIINQFLSCNRVVFLPHIVSKFTEAELATKLNISITQLRLIRQLPASYQKVAKHVGILLIDLYCNTKFQQPESTQPRGAL